MKNNITLIMVLTALFIPFNLFGVDRTCGTDDPTIALASTMRVVQQNWNNSASRLSVTDVVIPVHFHVIRYSDESGDVADELIFDQIDALSSAYSDTRFRFALNGITRSDNTNWTTHLKGSSYETAMKNALAVDVDEVLNVYLCNDPKSSQGTLLGYATFPDTYPQTDKRHGVVLHSGTVPIGGQVNYDKGKTLVHEVGHYFGLFHTFQNGCSSPGDDVSDTPYHTVNYGCPIGADTCGQTGVDPTENFMNYTYDYCMNEFTSGQADRMYAQTSTDRSTMWQNGLNQVSYLANVSTRLKIGTGNDLAIAGFYISGSQPEEVIVRGIGPSLVAHNLGVPILANPTMQLTDWTGSPVIGSNNDWKNPGSNQTQVSNTGLAPSNDLESAKTFSLSANLYMAMVSPSAGTQTGVGLVEVFDLNGASPNSRIINISTRGLTGSGANVMVGGFVIADAYKEVLIMGRGPSMTSLSNEIGDPVLTLYDQNGKVVGTNDDWNDTWNSDEILVELASVAGQGAPHGLESGMLKVLAPGLYTVFVENLLNVEGVGLFEVFDVNAY